MRTVFWEDNQVKMIDQRVLPARLEIVSLPEYLDVAKAIENMTVRGAPAIGASAAFGLALAAQRSPSSNSYDLLADLRTAAAVLKSARPTAVNLTWALNRVLRAAGAGDGEADNIRLAVLA